MMILLYKFYQGGLTPAAPDLASLREYGSDLPEMILVCEGVLPTLLARRALPLARKLI